VVTNDVSISLSVSRWLNEKVNLMQPVLIPLSSVWRIRGKLSELFCAVLCTTVVHNDTHTHTYEHLLKINVGLGLVFVFVHLFCVFFWFSLDYFVLVLFALIVLGLVSSVLRQGIGWGECLQNDPFCGEWDVRQLSQPTI